MRFSISKGEYMMDFERTFDNIASGYDQVRPEYPNELFNDIFKYKAINQNSSVLEIGVGTGKATLPFLETNCLFTGIEPGMNLADVAREKYKKYSNFNLHIKMLQEYECIPEKFDLIFAATSFHWIQEDYGYSRVFDLLKKGGCFARFSYHALPDINRPPITQEINAIYTKYLQLPEKHKTFCEQDAFALAKTALKYGFVKPIYYIYSIPKDFTANEYIKLLHTYPDHMRLAPDKRNALFDDIHSAISRYGGIITVNYIYDLELAIKP